MYLQTVKMSKKYMDKHGHQLYITPVFYLRLFNTFTRLLDERKKNVSEISTRYDSGLQKINNTMDELQGYHNRLEAEIPVLMDKQTKLVETVVDIEEEFEKVKAMRERMKQQEYIQE